MQEHLQRLCAVEISSAQMSIEGQVSMLVTFTAHRKHESTTNRRTDALQRYMTSCKNKIRFSLTMLVCWTESAGLPELTLSEEEIFNNQLPWQISGIDLSLEQRQLKLFRMECELKRCEEELLMLPSDAVCVLVYYSTQARLLQEWLVKEHPQPDVFPASGEVQLMFEKLMYVERLHAKALQVFKDCKLVK